ncbi:transmembrane and ubiquitin-like domain-containing protein 1 [Pholidichthys leucotaenia]
MALIEGVGDEVTLLFGILLLMVVLLLAWTSTSTPPEHMFATGPASAQSRQNVGPSPSSSSSSSVNDGGSTEASPTEETPLAPEAPPTQRNMVVRLKFLNDTERMAQVQPQDTVGYIKRTYFAGQEQQVRLIYRGQLLQDDARTLASLNLPDNGVLHCHISQGGSSSGTGAAAGGPGPGDQVQVALNVGGLMAPLLVLMLSVLWYCQIQYRHFFTAPATASLVGVTILLSMVAFGVYRR